MTTLATLIRHAEEPDVYGYVGPSVDGLREASKRVRVTEDGDGRIVVTIDGDEAYRTGKDGCGLWKWGHGDGDGTWHDGHGNYTPVRSWHQIVGTCQIGGRSKVRAHVVERLAWDTESAPSPRP